jgi:hypothetical protein
MRPENPSRNSSRIAQRRATLTRSASSVNNSKYHRCEEKPTSIEAITIDLIIYTVQLLNMSLPDTFNMEYMTGRRRTSNTTTNPNISTTNMPNPPVVYQEEQNDDGPSDSTPGHVESRASSSTTTNQPSFQRGIIRKNFNPAMMNHLEKYKKKQQEVLRGEEKLDVTMSAGERTEYNVMAGNLAKRVLEENKRFYKLAHHIGAKSRTTTPKPEMPQAEMESESTTTDPDMA